MNLHKISLFLVYLADILEYVASSIFNNGQHYKDYEAIVRTDFELRKIAMDLDEIWREDHDN